MNTSIQTNGEAMPEACPSSMQRRSFLKGAALLAASSAAAPASESAASDAPSLEALIASHARLLEADRGAWGIVFDIQEKLEAAGEYGLPKVQIASQLIFMGDGAQVSRPIYGYSEEEIRKSAGRDIAAIPGCLGEGAAAKIQKKCAERLADFRRQVAKREQMERESGLERALASAEETAERVKSVEAEIIDFAPATHAEAVRKAAWCVWAYQDSYCYLAGMDEPEKVLLQALATIARAPV